MTYNYNRLWTLLTNNVIIKTRFQAGISTNILAKMGKDKPVGMETLEKIASALQYELTIL